MEIGTCKDCKWWQQTDWPKNLTADYVEKMRKTETTTRDCRNPKLNGNTNLYGQLHDSSEACPVSSDETGLAFTTGQDFGCIHFTSK